MFRGIARKTRAVWKNLSVSSRFYIVIGTMGLLIATELLTLHFAMQTLSAVRAFVGGESSWSKAQKDAAFHLQRYGVTRNEDDFRRFLAHLRVPEGDHAARMELQKKNPDMEVVRENFLRGNIHADDIDPIVNLLRRFAWEKHLARAIEIWEDGDETLAKFKAAGIEYHRLLSRGASRDSRPVRQQLARIQALNDRLTSIEAEFSYVLGLGSRWLEGIVFSLLFLAVVTVEAIGITLTFLTTRYLSRGLAQVTAAADRIGRGDFRGQLAVESRDEIGQLSEALNRAGNLLKRSYRDLERRVEERTQELSQLAAENAKLYHEAQEAIRTRDEFMSIASHEMKTPLTSLHLQLQLLLRRANELPSYPEFEKIRTMAEASVRQARRLAVLSEELMDLTRIRIGKLEIRRSPCDLTGMVHDIVGQLSADAAAAGSQITLRSSGPVHGEADGTRFAQVITNLISNAIKYGEGNPIEVSTNALNGTFTLSVRDQGRGIAADEQARVFDRFERAGANGDEKVSGLGLGLYISREIVIAHQGDIRVTSEVGKGSTFTVEIPLRAAQTVTEAWATPVLEQPARGPEISV